MKIFFTHVKIMISQERGKNRKGWERNQRGKAHQRKQAGLKPCLFCLSCSRLFGKRVKAIGYWNVTLSIRNDDVLILQQSASKR
jgi:hypothetical protein